MEKEFAAKTVEEAKALAEQEFGVSEEDIDFEILEQPKKSLFGGYKGAARVKAIYEPSEKAEQSSPIFDSAEGETDENNDDKSDAAAETYDPDEGESGKLPVDFDINKSRKVRSAIEYLTNVLHALGLENFKITPVKRDDNIVLDITGEKLGIVIGKRGETLDSLQYLAILASNRSDESFCRISLDCNGYRDKRRETLETLAKKTSAKVIKQGRKIALEPMNPYERRIIHSCVAEIDGVSSRSSGTEPYRKVVIYADKPKFDRDRGGRDRRRGDRRSSGESGSARNYRRSGGFSTSFEREYKRKQSQVDENSDAGEFSKETVDTEKNAALYGKIEL